MAFLCPVRIKKNKRKKDGDTRTPPLGRITGSASIETLVRVGLEKENGLSPDSKMVVLHDFSPCVDDELEVKRGQLVNVLYQENDWVYVIADKNREGFIPHSYCAPSKKLPSRDCSQSEESTPQSDIDSDTKTVPDAHPFFKDPTGARYIVLYTFIARDENDVSVERGEYVTVLNKDDPDWLWIVRSDGQEGFVPSAFVCPAEILHGQDIEGAEYQKLLPFIQGFKGLELNKAANQVACNDASAPAPNGADCGSELVMLYEYKAQAPDDLSVRRGDWVYADLNNQTVDGWLWAYHPKTRKYGFIPKAYARPPAMTSL